MAKIDVSFLLTDPDFTDQVTRIQRSSTVNEWGEQVITESTSTITAVVQGPSTEILARFPNLAQLSDAISVWYKGQLTAQKAGGYSDVIVWSGKRYQVKEVSEDFASWGEGFTMAICELEPASNG